MLSLFIFIILIFNAATHPDPDPSIIFNIQSERSNGQSVLTCDHTRYRVAQQPSTYTVYEGEKFTILTKYNETINVFKCYDPYYEDFDFTLLNTSMKYGTSAFMAEKKMGTIWKCMILAHRDDIVSRMVVQYKNHYYSSVYCYTRIHVRQKEAPQTILVNNMELQAVRTNPSQKDVDFIAQYLYVDGDVVNVICINFGNNKMLTMEYNMAGRRSDKSTMDDLSSNKTVGFVTKLHSGHNNSYMKCTRRENDDFTKVMVRFVMRTNCNFVSLKINGMFVRPHLDYLRNSYYRINYKYEISKFINVTCEVCEVDRADLMLYVLDGDLDKVSSYKKTELIQNKKIEISFYLSGAETNKQIVFGIDYFDGTSEKAVIYFTEASFPIEQYPLHMDLPPCGRVMELFNDYTRNVIFYEFNETFQFTCGQLPDPVLTLPNLYLELDSKRCETVGCTIYKQKYAFRKEENTAVACYLKAKAYPPKPGKRDIVLRKITVIFRERVLTTPTTSTSTTTSTTTPSTALATTHTAANPASSETPTYSSNNDSLLYSLTGVGVLLIVIILVVLYYTIIKKRCCVRSSAQIQAPRIDPGSVYYENLLAVFQPLNEREAAQTEENQYEEIK